MSGWHNYIMIYMILSLSSCTHEAPRKKADLPVPVDIAIAQVEDIPISLETIGTVYARITVQLRPQVQGKILETHVTQGDYVKEGELLYTIDPRPYQATLDKQKAILDKDEALLKFARQKLERYSYLEEKHFVSPLTLEELKSNVDSLIAQIAGDKAAVELAKIDLEHCKVYAPIDGKISQFQIDVGNLVTAFEENALTEILQIQPVEVRFSFPQKDFMEIKKYYSYNRLPFTVTDPNHTDIEFKGEVNFIDNKIDVNTGTILLKGTVDNPEEALWPGAFVWVRIFLKTEKNAIVVPKEAVSIGQQGPYVFVVKPDMTAELRQISLGSEEEGKRIILSGVEPKELVVTDGQLNLRPGSKVWIKKNGEKTAE